MDERNDQGTAGRCPEQQHARDGREHADDPPRDPAADPARCEASFPPEDVWDDSEEGAEDDEDALPYWIDQDDE